MLLLPLNHLNAQGDFYSTSQVQDIYLKIDVQNWAGVLDSLMAAHDDVTRIPCTVTLNGQVFKEAGVRYKGFSSWNKDSVKNPFNISLDYHFQHANYQGYTSIKLSNVIHDPSFLREILSYQIARKYMPASRANFARLYVNDTLIGLYTNVESVDDHFLDEHFQSSHNCFFKGSPVTLIYPFGQNSNLADSHGTDSLDYVPFYKMESDYGWSELYQLIDILNNNPDSLENILNTDRTLWMHAFNFTLSNLDSYIGYSQNYYMYRDDQRRFNPILWDLNMSWGSFRHSDGSYNYNGLTINEIKTLDPLTHLSFCITPRPLIVQLLSNATYKRMFLAHIRTILKENFVNGEYYNQAMNLHQFIEPYVLEDVNKFYSNEDFYNNIDTTVGGSSGMIQYPGLRDLMETRTDYLMAYRGIQGEPVISEISQVQPVAGQSDPAWITARVQMSDTVFLAFRFSSSGVFKTQMMWDDGLHRDGQAGDGVYGSCIDVKGNIIQFYLYAQNDSAGVFSPERAANEYYTWQVGIYKGDVIINEIKTSGGSSTHSPEAWVEILNTTAVPLNLRGVKVESGGDGVNSWVFPDTLLPSKRYIVVNTGSDSLAGLFYAPLSLSTTEGAIGLFTSDALLLDSASYGLQHPDMSFGRYPNGYGGFQYLLPTPAKNNLLNREWPVFETIYPNPASDHLYLEYEGESPEVLEILSSDGKLIRKSDCQADRITGGNSLITVDISGIRSGCYFIRSIGNSRTNIHKFLIVNNL